MGTIMGIAPAIAPVLGGYLTVHYGWYAVFLFLFGYGILAMVLTTVFLQESLDQKDKHATRPLQVLSNYRELLSSLLICSMPVPERFASQVSSPIFRHLHMC
ncbi:MFS transporter [Sneathiella glossodoripedis]|uniref:MFS transporter n=1 Tax=Sneathiella glossodoripedis TaxID=418853 RepID=UPI000A95354C|nr:MFS transporter [Sneathiella glossodoripedis]